MKIAIDAMGGDHAPQAVVAGAVLAAREGKDGIVFVLVGDETRVKAELSNLGAAELSNIEIVHSSQTVEMSESPVLSIRKKKDSSIMKAASLIKENKADALVTAGNTGAAVAATKIKWRSLPGVERPAIAVIMPSPYGIFVILDGGATPDCRPIHLKQFAIMGDVYAKCILKIKNPKTGLLSVGTEETKGTDLTKDAYKLLQNSKADINFIGNVEGNDLFTEKVDVIVCDGYVGNVVLKVCESLAGAFGYLIKEEIMKKFWAKIGALVLKPTFKRIARRIHYEEYGGAPLLGVNGNCIICHGRSNPQAIKNAINVAKHMVRDDLNKRIIEEIAKDG